VVVEPRTVVPFPIAPAGGTAPPAGARDGGLPESVENGTVPEGAGAPGYPVTPAMVEQAAALATAGYRCQACRAAGPLVLRAGRVVCRDGCGRVA
jgi:hypothetical protein